MAYVVQERIPELRDELEELMGQRLDRKQEVALRLERAAHARAILVACEEQLEEAEDALLADENRIKEIRVDLEEARRVFTGEIEAQVRDFDCDAADLEKALDKADAKLGNKGKNKKKK